MSCTIVFTFILLVSLSWAPLLQHSHLIDSPSEIKALADFESQELVWDPDLATEPDVFIINESGEFSADYETDGEDGRAVLVWNHTAGTQLDFPVFPEHNFIDCSDFIYLFQPLRWESRATPYRVRLVVEYGFDVTGTFKTNESGLHMFSPFVYLITENYWTPIAFGMPRINGTSQSFLFDLQEETINSAWSDLEYTVNEINLAIGFAPDRWFNEHWDGSEPWRNYTGTVAMTIERIGAKALSGSPASVEEIEPVHVGYESQGNYEHIVDIADAGDGTVYSLSADYGDSPYRATLVRWSENADVLWSSKTNGSCSILGVAIDVYGGSVYAIGMYHSVAGPESPILLRWSSDGTLTLAKDLNLELNRVSDLIVTDEDSIYFTGYRYQWEFPYGSTEYLIKIDHEGAIIWEAILGTSDYGGALLEASAEGDIYALNVENLTKWDQDANLLWNKTGLYFDIELSPSGSVCTIELTYSEAYYSSWIPHTYLVERNSEGVVLWNHSIDIQYSETWSEPIWPYFLEIATDGSLYLLFEIRRNEQRFRLAKYDSSGAQLWNKSLAPLSNETGYWFDGRMDLGRNGLIHIIGRYYDTESKTLRFRMLVYFDSSYPVDLFSLPETRFAIALVVISALVVGDIVRRRKGLRFRT